MPFEIYQVEEVKNSPDEEFYLNSRRVESEQEYDFFNLLTDQLDLNSERGKVLNMMLLQDKYSF